MHDRDVFFVLAARDRFGSNSKVEKPPNCQEWSAAATAS